MNHINKINYLLVFGILLILIYLFYQSYFSQGEINSLSANSIIINEGTFEEVIDLSKKETNLPVNLPSKLPFHPTVRYANAEIIKYENNEQFLQISFNYKNDNHFLRLIINNIHDNREYGEKIKLNNNIYNYINREYYQQVWWEYESGVYYTLIFLNKDKNKLNDEELFAIINQIEKGKSK